MQERLISFETGKLSKEKGFNYNFYYGFNEDKSKVWIDCKYRNDGDAIYNFMNKYYPAVSQTLLQMWLVKEHNIVVLIDITTGYEQYFRWKYFKVIIDNNHKKILECLDDKDYKTYEEALEIGLQEALKLI